MQAYDSEALDACALLIPPVGFLTYDDEHVLSTIETIAEELTEDSLVLRYRTDESDDGLASHEGFFLVCSFWLVEALHGIGRVREAEELFERLLELCNDVGLLSEEYDPLHPAVPQLWGKDPARVLAVSGVSWAARQKRLRLGRSGRRILARDRS